MGTILASAIISKASIQLIDPTNVRWTQSELLGWLNSGQRQIAQVDPSAANSVAVVKLVAGARQTLPANGFMFFEAFRNMGTDGLTPGRTVRIATRETLDAYNRDWYSAAQSAVTQSYIFNSIDNKAYYVYPPSDGTNYLEINYAATPSDVALTDPIGLPDIYENALLDYVLFRAFSKDTEGGNPALAQFHFQQFSSAISADQAVQAAADANKATTPGNTPWRQ